MVTQQIEETVVCVVSSPAQSTMINQIVERIYVQDKQVVAMTLHSNCHLVLAIRLHIISKIGYPVIQDRTTVSNEYHGIRLSLRYTVWMAETQSTDLDIRLHIPLVGQRY